MVFKPQKDMLVAGRYQLRKRIGEGGMGSVWEAVDKVLDCPIALKVLTESDARDEDPDQHVARFMREAKLSASVQHPSVVRVTDFGLHEDTPYIAMELLRGESLSERMYRLPLLEPHEVVQICLSLLRGLGAAHEVGVVHRDIKPDNVLLVEDIEGFYPKLIDFGISLGFVRQKRVSAVTTGGHVFGTPMYMSPEQARGDAVDGRADLYSVGVLLYELLARRAPFPEGTPVELMAAILRDVPPAPREIRPAVGVALSDVVMRAIEKPRDKRFRTAREMANALTAAGWDKGTRPDTTGPIRLQRAVSEPLEAFPEESEGPDTETAGYPIQETLPTSGGRVALFAVLALFLAGGATWWMTQADQPAPRAEDGRAAEPIARGADELPEDTVVVRDEAPIDEAPIEEALRDEAPSVEPETAPAPSVGAQEAARGQETQHRVTAPTSASEPPRTRQETPGEINENETEEERADPAEEAANDVFRTLDY